MTLQTPQSATTIYLDQPPSCLQSCPSSPNHFLIGTYLLTETKDEAGTIQQTKTGSLQLWHLTPEANSLSLIQKVPLPYAVFDLHFHPRDPNLLAIATSAASVALFRLSSPTPTPEIHPVWTKPVHEDPTIPALFLAWTPQNWLNETETETQADGFAVTFSDGRTSVFGCSQGTTGLVEEDAISEWASFAVRETIEVWFVALGIFPDNDGSQVPFLFTGDDFGSLQTRRFGAEREGELLSGVLGDWDDRGRNHGAGVTAILPLPVGLEEGAPVVLTGSYDESLRVYRATRRGEVLAEVGLGGGVWRLQLVRTGRRGLEDGGKEWVFLVLASCMHAGTRVVRVTRTLEQWDIEVLAEFTEHESMNYASDVWKPEGGYDLQGKEMSELLCVSSSFYDRRLCVWRVNV